MTTGIINIEVSFPIINLVENEFSVCQNLSEYTICKRSYIPILSKLKEFIIDSTGVYYKRTSLSFLRYINIFKGFSLKYASFGVCYVSKNIERVRELSIDELKKTGFDILKSQKEFFSGTMLNIKKWETEFKELDNREDVLRYMFYFVDTSRYHNPDIKDLNWRERRGFVK